MKSLIEETPEAAAWVEQEQATRAAEVVFERFLPAVIWIDESGPNHEAIGGNNPTALIENINNEGQPTFLRHDPGSPLGRVVAARDFVAPDGVRFVAALLGFYGDRQRVRFGDLGVDSALPVSPPSTLPDLPGDPWFVVQTDPREVDSRWLDDLLEDPPFRVKRQRASHNAADVLSELIRVGMPYMLVVWNPFVTTIAKKAAEDVYAATHRWLRKLWDKLQECKNPIVSLQSFQDDCEVSFLFRGKDVKVLCAAHDTLAAGAAQAASLIRGIHARGERVDSLVYEFDQESSRWFPSYANPGERPTGPGPGLPHHR